MRVPCGGLDAVVPQALKTPPPTPAELRTAHEGLSHEMQRLQQLLAELTGELQARDAGMLC